MKESDQTFLLHWDGPSSKESPILLAGRNACGSLRRCSLGEVHLYFGCWVISTCVYVGQGGAVQVVLSSRTENLQWEE